MPELPEVQTIVSDLNKKIIGWQIIDFWSEWPKAIKSSSYQTFRKNIKGKKILDVKRIGKNIFIDLSGGLSLQIHLKMTGHLLVKDKKAKILKERANFQEKVNQYIHHIWFLAKSKKTKKENCQLTLAFSDLRKFAKIVLVKTKEINDLPEIKKLGIDAMARQFTFQKFQEILKQKPKSLIGILLMDQNIIAGIGNIYRSEILFQAKVYPKKRVAKLTQKEAQRIFDQIKIILKKAIRMRGTSDSDYRDTSGAPGRYHKMLKVYRLDGSDCQKCGTKIKRIKMAQRSVFYCPKCQK
jgi:formamidopyrimidine-DNA glycosylase